MVEDELRLSDPSGVSIIILTYNGANHLDRFFTTFFAQNSYSPVEFIIIDHASTDNTADIVQQYASNSFMHYIRRDSNYTYAASNNMAAQEALYSNLLLVNNDIIYTADILPLALSYLTDPSIGAVGVRLDDFVDGSRGEKPQRVQHAGVTFVWDEKSDFFRPTQIRYESVEALTADGASNGIYPAVTAAFLLCNKQDFFAVGGFCEEYDYGFEDIDFCLKLAIELDKKCFCINEVALQHLEGATRKKVDPEVKKKRHAHNDAIFRRRMGQKVKELMDLGKLAGDFFNNAYLNDVREDLMRYEQHIY